MDISSLDNLAVLKLYSQVMDELQRRSITHSTNNPIANLAEYLATTALSLRRMPESTKGYDAIDHENMKYEIKGRRPTRQNSSRQLSAIRELDKKHFDYLVGVLFNEDLTVKRACIIPHNIVLRESTYRNHTNAWIFHLRDSLWQLETVKDVTEKLQGALANQAL